MLGAHIKVERKRTATKRSQMSDNGNTKEMEKLALEFAGHLTNLYVETVSILVGLSDTNVNARTDLLCKVRDTELAKVDALERLLGIRPRTAEIRKMWKEWEQNETQ